MRRPSAGEYLAMLKDYTNRDISQEYDRCQPVDVIER